VNSDRYVSDSLEPFFQELTEEKTRHGYFQQDSATAHTTRNSMQHLEDVFDDEQIISQGLWLPHSPDLSICDFYLWGNLKRKVYKKIHKLQMHLKLKQETLCVPSMEKNFREFSENS
jgi:hypothetical protein